MATVKLYFNVEGLLRKCYREIAGLPRKVADVNWFAVDVSIRLHLSESQICIFWVLTIVVSTLRVSTTKNVLKFFSTRPYKQHIPMKITLEHTVEVKNTRLTGSSWNLGSDTSKEIMTIMTTHLANHLRTNMQHTHIQLLSYDPYGPARAFIAKLLRKSLYEGRTRWRE